MSGMEGKNEADDVSEAYVKSMMAKMFSLSSAPLLPSSWWLDSIENTAVVRVCLDPRPPKAMRQRARLRLLCGRLEHGLGVSVLIVAYSGEINDAEAAQAHLRPNRRFLPW